MSRIRDNLCVALGATLVMMALGGCAAGAPGSGTDPTEKQRINAEKQEALRDMLEKGQR